MDAVYGYIHGRVLDQRISEAICGETFLHAVRQLATFAGGEADFGGWLMATAGSLIDVQLRAITATE